MDDAQLQTVWQNRQPRQSGSHLSGPLAVLMKRQLGRRVKQLAKVAQVWDEIVPDDIRQHTALEGFQRGVLTVMVDSSPHRFKLQNLLLAGLQREIQSRLPMGLNKIRLVPGQFYSIDVNGEQRYEF